MMPGYTITPHVTYYIKYILDDYMKDLKKNEIAIISSIDTYDGKSRQEAVLTTPEPEEERLYDDSYCLNCLFSSGYK